MMNHRQYLQYFQANPTFDQQYFRVELTGQLRYYGNQRTISNLDSLSSTEMGVDPGIRS
jgi:hypothetical protein